MDGVQVRFVYITGLKRYFFRNARLVGEWDQWTPVAMQEAVFDDGCPCFSATVTFEPSQVGKTFRWGVRFDTPLGADRWAIATEVKDSNSTDLTRVFTLRADDTGRLQEERYYLTYCRRLGAQKYFPNGAHQRPALRFAVWAPDASEVSVVFGSWNSGYIDDDGGGRDPVMPAVPLQHLREPEDGIWESDLRRSPQLGDFVSMDHVPYMFQIKKDGGNTIAYRTDLYSRCQIGAGSKDPEGQPYNKTYRELDGTVSCSVVVDPDTVTSVAKQAEWPQDRDRGLFVSEQEFWRNEFDLTRPLPGRIEDLIIYELHIASLAAGRKDANGEDEPGTFNDAIRLLDEHIVPLGVNAIELLPVAEFGGHNEWGYGDTHHCTLEFRSGGRDQFKHFIRACHQRGIAVIMDVVYNHFSPRAERAEDRFDSDAPDKNIYYWYEGRPSDYRSPDGGYIDNGSTGRAPRYWEEHVRKLFISSAASLVTEFRIDGFRVDLTQAIHRDNFLHENGTVVSSANAFGAKFLREWARTLNMIKPSVFLIAEDHTGWEKVTQPADSGGLGFDATWYVDFYHNLVGVPADDWASVVARAGVGGDTPLNIDALAGSLAWTGQQKVVYHISHDEAGNSGQDEPNRDKRSHRTLVQAVHGANNLASSRNWAEARCRFAVGLSMLSAGTPMFLMGEEVGFIKDYKYNDYLKLRENLDAERLGAGAHLFRFYHDVIALRKDHPAARSRELTVLHVSSDNRVIAFRRRSGNDDILVFASLNNRPFSSGYWIYHSDLDDGLWKEVFNSDGEAYGGYNIGNSGGMITTREGYIGPVVPQNGFVVLQRS